MDLRLQFQVGAFNGAMRDMAARLGDPKTQMNVINYEVARIVEKALVLTKAASIAGIRKDWMAKDWTTYNKKHYKLNDKPYPFTYPKPRTVNGMKYLDGTWSGIQEYRKRLLIKKLGARGLAKRSWLELGISFGQNIKAPGYVVGAISKGHTGRENVSARQQPSTRGYGLVIQNSSPLLQFSDARRAFFSAVAGRRRFYETNVAKGVFNDLKQVAKKYPGMLITP